MISIFVRTIILYLVLTITMKIMGKRQLGELEVSELVTTLLISEVAAIPIDDPDLPLLNTVLSVLFLVSAEILITHFKNRSETLKRAVEGEPVYIIYKGSFRQSALAENRLSVNEVLSEFRIQGVSSPSDVNYAILEPNGKISILLKGDAQPLTIKPQDPSAGLSHAIIIDGAIRSETLTSLGYDGKWLEKQLAREKCDAKDVFLLMVDDGGRTVCIKKEKTR